MYLLVPKRALQAVCPFVAIAHLPMGCIAALSHSPCPNPILSESSKVVFPGQLCWLMNQNFKVSGSPTMFDKGLNSRMVLGCQLLHSHPVSSVRDFRFIQRHSSVILEMEKDNLGSKIEVNLYNVAHIPHLKAMITMLRVRHLRKMC